MRISGNGNRPVNIWEVQKKASERLSKQLGGKKIKSKPTDEQLASIEESQRRESKALKDNSNLVPIDWEYVKETINLTDEERKIRDQQDKLDLDMKFYDEMAAIENEYQAGIAKIEEGSEARQKETDTKNKAKAQAIIANIAKGMMVSPFDLAFANDVAPEKVAKAMRDAQESKNDSNNNAFITQILSSMDYKI